MKKIFACMSLVMLSSTATAVQLDSQFYGKLNLSYDSFDPGQDDWVSNASRVGLKGSYAPNDSLKVIYQIEQGVDAAHGGKDVDTIFSTRNSFVGVQGEFGKFIFGSHDTPAKKVQGKIDQFNDLQADIKQMLAGEVRARDAYLYTSPKLAEGIEILVMHVPSDKDFGSSQSYAINYSKDGLFLAFGFDDDMRKNDKASDKNKVYQSLRFAVQYKFGDLTLGGIVEKSEQQNLVGADSNNGYILSAAYKVDSLVFRAQLGKSDITAPNRESVAIGIDYKYNKQVKLFSNYVDQQDDKGDKTILETGIEVKF